MIEVDVSMNMLGCFQLIGTFLGGLTGGGAAAGAASTATMGATLSAIGSLAGLVGQMQSAKKQKAYQDHLAEMQRQAGLRKEAAVITQNIQAGEATARKKYQISQQGAKAASAAELAAIEGGVTGLSIDYFLDEYEAQEGAYMYALSDEARLREAETKRTLGDIHLSTEQQMASTNAPVTYPSLVGGLLKAGAGYYGKLSEIKRWEEGGTDNQLFDVPILRGNNWRQPLPTGHAFA